MAVVHLYNTTLFSWRVRDEVRGVSRTDLQPASEGRDRGGHDDYLSLAFKVVSLSVGQNVQLELAGWLVTQSRQGLFSGEPQQNRFIRCKARSLGVCLL